MDIEEILRTGSEICEDVLHAVNTNNYNGLGSRINDRVSKVTGQFTGSPNSWQNRQNGANAPGQGYPQGQGPYAGQYGGQQNPGGTAPYGGQAPYRNQTQPGQSNSHWNRDLSRQQPSYFLTNRVKKATGIGKVIAGSVLTGINGLGTIVSAGVAIAAAGATAALWTLGAFSVLTAGSIVLLINGSKNRDLVNKYYKYGKTLGQSEFFSVKALAQKLGLQEKELRKDLDQMMKKGYLPQAKYDRGETTVMLTDHAWEQYQQAEESWRRREEEEKARQEEEKRLEERLGSSAVGRDAREVLKQGGAYLKRVREINDQIPDTEEMSNKLYRLEEIMNKIFEQVEKQPESAQSLRRFMEYYLPTTEKLLNAYVDLGKQPEVGDNITKPRQEIEETMDTINDAFEKLLDSLFEDVAWDISSDISVMKTMMAQDGLTQEAEAFQQEYRG